MIILLFFFPLLVHFKKELSRDITKIKKRRKKDLQNTIQYNTGRKEGAKEKKERGAKKGYKKEKPKRKRGEKKKKVFCLIYSHMRLPVINKYGNHK
jgi:hypothetical protein